MIILAGGLVVCFLFPLSCNVSQRVLQLFSERIYIIYYTLSYSLLVELPLPSLIVNRTINMSHILTGMDIQMYITRTHLEVM